MSEKYSVSGMSCAACSAHVEKAVKEVDGVKDVAVNLLTNSMVVKGSASSDLIIDAVKKAGYGAEVLSLEKKNISEKNKQSENNAFLEMRNRLIFSLVIMIPLMYVSMGHVMFSLPVPSFLNENAIAIALYQMILSIIVMVINKKFFVSGMRSAVHGSANMDTLVSLGSGSSFLISVYELFLMTVLARDGNLDGANHLIHNLYFESAAMILTLITIGKTLEEYSKGRTTDALKKLISLAPNSAIVLYDGIEKSVSIEKIVLGDIIVVRSGQKIPCDGTIIEGAISVNESMLTGESVPIDKTVGDKVSAATISVSGFCKFRVEKIGEDTTFSKIVQLVSDASSSKAPIAKAADKVSAIFVPCVLVIALVTLIVWLCVGQELNFALSKAIAVLVVSCPCALGLATPVAIMVGNGIAASNGILFKDAASLEITGRAKTVVFDKTGTITEGKTNVTDVWTFSGLEEDKENLLHVAASLEEKSSHPFAKAILDYCKNYSETNESFKNNFFATDDKSFDEILGKGVKAKINGKNYFGGNFLFIQKQCEVLDLCKEKIDEFSNSGKTPLCFCTENKFLGIIAVSDTIKKSSEAAISELKSMGIKTVMLTGDNEKVAAVIGKISGVDKIIAGVLPAEKEAAVKALKAENNKVIMVGDGINDAPALISADVGIAIGAGSDIAIDSASVVLTKSDLGDVPRAIRLSRKALRVIHENLFWAFGYNVIGIPLAAGVWYYAFGLELTPMFGAAAMSVSSFLVVMNALRLNLFRFDKKQSRKNKMKENKMQKNINNFMGENKMTKTIQIKGMMCAHCQMHVTNALDAIDGVKSNVDFKTGTALLTLSKDVKDETLSKAVTDAGYEVVSIK